MDKALFLFTTDLANQATEEVKAGRYPTIVAFHKSLEETKRCFNKSAHSRNSPSKVQQSTSGYALSDPSSIRNSGNECQSSRLGSMTPLSGDSVCSGMQRSNVKMPPPNIKLESPLSVGGCPLTPTNGPSSVGYKRDLLSDPLPPTILPYGMDASNVPITDTHYGNFTNNGDPLEKMARLTQEALPFEPPLKQPKIESNLTCNESKSSSSSSSISNLSKIFDPVVSLAGNCVSTTLAAGGGATNDAGSKMYGGLEDQLTPSQLQHRQECLQKMEQLRNAFTFLPKASNQMPGMQPQMQHMPMQFVPGMPCVAAMNNMDMMVNMSVSMNAASTSQCGPQLLMSAAPMPVASSPDSCTNVEGLLKQQDVYPPPVLEKTTKGGRSSTPKSATAKNSAAKNAAANRNGAAGATMMVQGKPAVMVHPNMNAKSARANARTSMAAAADKYYPGGSAGPPNVTFGDPAATAAFGVATPVQGGGVGSGGCHFANGFPGPGAAALGPCGADQFGAGPPFVVMQQPNAMGGGQRCFMMQPGSSGPAAARFCGPPGSGATTVILNNGQPRMCASVGAGPLGAGSGPSGPPNVNLNMNIQINAQPHNLGPQPADIMAGGGTAGASGPLNPNMCYSTAVAGDYGPAGLQMFEDEEIFFDPIYGPSGVGPPNVNIAVTGVYPQMGPGGTQQGAGGGGGYFPCSGPASAPPPLLSIGDEYGSGAAFGGGPCTDPMQQSGFGGKVAGCNGGSPFLNATMSFQHGAASAAGSYGPISFGPQMTSSANSPYLMAPCQNAAFQQPAPPQQRIGTYRGHQQPPGRYPGQSAPPFDSASHEQPPFNKGFQQQLYGGGGGLPPPSLASQQQQRKPSEPSTSASVG